MCINTFIGICDLWQYFFLFYVGAMDCVLFVLLSWVLLFFQACWMVHQFSEIRFKQANSLEQAVTLTRQALCTDKELPVRVEAAVALQMLLSNQDKGNCFY